MCQTWKCAFKDIKKQQNQDFTDTCNMLVDNKLIIHFGDKNNKSILFPSIGKIKNIPKLDIICENFRIKQHSRDTNLSCILN